MGVGIAPSNANDISKNGFYFVNTYTFPDGGKNYGDMQIGFLLHLKNGSHIVQIQYTTKSDAMQKRSYHADRGWSDWKTIQAV